MNPLDGPIAGLVEGDTFIRTPQNGRGARSNREGGIGKVSARCDASSGHPSGRPRVPSRLPSACSEMLKKKLGGHSQLHLDGSSAAMALFGFSSFVGACRSQGAQASIGAPTNCRWNRFQCRIQKTCSIDLWCQASENGRHLLQCGHLLQYGPLFG